MCEFEEVAVGDAVWVPFTLGNKRRRAYVFQVIDEPETKINRLKFVEEIEKEISLNPEIINTCLWMKKRYLCKYIDVVKCFTPAGNKLKKGVSKAKFDDSSGENLGSMQLTLEQREAVNKIFPYVERKEHRIFLIHGVTGSGKTEVYMQVIGRCLENNETAIMMVPEISLTKQVIERFIGRFGAENIAVLHSKLTERERYDEWIRIRRGEVKIVIGARSAVFAPLSNIGAIIMDEEHEATYKSDKTPKYDTVEVALKRAKTHGSILVLGSATPSVVSNSRAVSGIYDKVKLTERYNQVPLPQVQIVDMRKELRDGNKSIFSDALYRELNLCLQDKKQAILFLNRRGYSTFISCRECGFAMKCPNCSISLTYHKEENAAICHYCGHTTKIPTSCPECGSKYFRHFGIGTEKIEESMEELFPDVKTLRLDLDTIKKKGSLDKILTDFSKRKADVLIGTQIVAKGLDFRNVGLVGVIMADSTLNLPDFRSAERTFQLTTQAAGRAGRGDEKGKVIVQTYSPEHYAIVQAAKQNYEDFYLREIQLRKLLNYPPYCDLFEIIFAGQEEKKVIDAAKHCEKRLKEALEEEDNKNIFTPKPAPIYKLGENFRYHILIKCPKGRRNKYALEIDKIRKEVSMNKKNKYNMYIDVNPYSFI